MARLKTDDLNWPFPKARIEPLYDELAGRRQRADYLIFARSARAFSL